jgi:serine/threonine-protein kinase RsbW
MAALRYTIRALAKQGIPPGEILELASQELDVTTDDHFATVLVGVVDTRMQELILASAGHPPPLMLHEGRAEYLRISPGMPLGVRGGPRPEPITVYFRPGSTLVAFTDGLIEQRTQSLDAGLAQLAAAAAETPSGPDDLIAHLVTTLVTSDQEDDIAVVAIRFSNQSAKPKTPDPLPTYPLTLTDPAST